MFSLNVIFLGKNIEVSSYFIFLGVVADIIRGKSKFM